MTEKSSHATQSDSPSSSVPSAARPSADTTRINEQPDPVSHYDSFPHSQAVDEDDQPPAYGEIFGHLENEQEDIGTQANVADDGRVNIRINQKGNRLSNFFQDAIQRQQIQPLDQEPYVPPGLGRRADRTRPPKLNVVIHVVGSRGDVQPFVALGKVLKEQHNHRVRLATHPVFRDFVNDNGLEFFSIGGDPSELMAFMVKNPGLMPGFDTLRSGDVGHRRKEIGKMVKGCWRSCIESGDGTGPEASDNTIEDSASADSGIGMEPQAKPFVADAIIANPPSFGHIHCAEKLGVPLHMMFTMPWSPTQAFPHPLANIQSSNADISMTNFMSYALVDMMTWQGLGDVINRFRSKTLGLDEISLTWAPGMLARMKIPYTYCWSPALIPKPRDWQKHISISGFYFLNLASNYTPEPDLKAFLDAGPPPVYIGFGSIVVDDPNGMTNLIFEAVKQTGQRALVSKGWGGFGAEDLTLPEGVFMLGNVPHDWLFKHVSAVVHHGGAGTTAAGISAGKPTVIVPFFGDQPFWGAMVNKAGAGPAPIPNKKLTADALAAAITEALSPACVEKAKEMSARISEERGTDSGAESFHQELDVDKLRCQLSPNRAAVWRIRRTDFRLSAFAAAVLAHERLLDFKDLKLYRPTEYNPDEGPWDPITGGAGALIGTMGSMAMGIADMPVATLKALKIHPERRRASEDQAAQSAQPSSGASTPSHSRAASQSISSSDLRSARTDALQNVDSKHRRASSASSVSSSRSGKEGQEAAAAQSVGSAMMSFAAGKQKEVEKQKPFKFNAEDLDTLLGTGKGAWRFTEAGIKSPLDFTLAMAKGFHNAPKLYGDDTVRKPDKITDFQTGLKAAGKEFGFGLYDGIAGLVTQPLRGAKKEGAAGFVKGFGKGIGGIALKPSAAIWALPGFAAQGMYRELRNRFGPSVEGYIIAARTAQGLDDMQASTSEEYTQVIKDWDDIRKDIKKKKRVGEEKMEEIKGRYKEARSRSRSASCSSKDGRPAEKEKEPLFSGHPLRRAYNYDEKDNAEEGPSQRVGAIHDTVAGARGQMPAPQTIPEDPELEEAIQQSIRETSRGNQDEDWAIEKAIRASVTELQSAQARGADTTQISQAMQQSLADARRGNLSRGSSFVKQNPEASGAAQYPEHPKAAQLGDRGSSQAASGSQTAQSTQDADLERAITESKQSETAGQTDEVAELQRAISESKQAAESSGADDEFQLKRAMTESLEAHDKHSEERRKAQEEEDIVLKYVMKQSEAEERMRQGKTGESSKSAGG